MVTYVLLEAENHSSLMDLIQYSTIKSLKFTVATELRKLFPCNCSEQQERVHFLAETSSSAGDSVAASNFTQMNDSGSHPTPASVPAVALMDTASSTNSLKREGGDIEVWENEPATTASTNREFASASDAVLEERVAQLEATVEKMSTKILDLERSFRSGSLTKSSFGRKEVKSSEQHIFRSPGPKFNDLDLAAEYSAWRTYVPDLLYMNEERKISSFIKHIYSKVVRNEHDKLLLTTRSGGRDNGLLRVPNELRVAIRVKRTVPSAYPLKKCQVAAALQQHMALDLPDKCAYARRGGDRYSWIARCPLCLELRHYRQFLCKVQCRFDTYAAFSAVITVDFAMSSVKRDFVVNVCDPPDRLALGAAVLKCMKTVADNVRRQTNIDANHEQDDNSSFTTTPRKRKLPQQGTATYQSAALTQMQSDEGAGLDGAPGME